MNVYNIYCVLTCKICSYGLLWCYNVAYIFIFHCALEKHLLPQRPQINRIYPLRPTFSGGHAVGVTLQFLGSTVSCDWMQQWTQCLSLHLAEARQQPASQTDRQWCLGWGIVRDQYSRDSPFTALSIIHKSLHGWPIKHTHTNKLNLVAKKDLT